MKLGIIGCGAIGSDVAKAADSFDEISHIFLCDIVKEKENEIAQLKERVSRMETLIAGLLAENKGAQK